MLLIKLWLIHPGILRLRERVFFLHYVWVHVFSRTDGVNPIYIVIWFFIFKNSLTRMSLVGHVWVIISHSFMMTSSNGNIFRVTGHLCGEFTGPQWIPTQRPVTRSFDVFFDLRLIKWLSKQPWGCWFETLSCPLWRHHNVYNFRVDRHPSHNIYSFMKIKFWRIWMGFLMKQTS